MARCGVDLQEPYFAISGADEEAPPFLDKAPPSSAGPPPRSCRELLRWHLIVVLVICLVVAVLALGSHFYTAMVYANAPSFTVRLAGCDGIDAARPAHIVSPAFRLTLRMNKTCADRADVVASYAGVALGWARVEPRDCAGERPGRDVAVVACGHGVGLSRDLRERMASERRRAGTVELDVEVTVYNDVPDRFFAPHAHAMVISCKLPTDGRRASESEPCTWYSLYPILDY